MTGLSIFACAIALLVVARVLLVCGLFLPFERIMQSSRLAALATIIYMSNWNFVAFDAQFAYESLALVCAAAITIGLICAIAGFITGKLKLSYLGAQAIKSSSPINPVTGR
jgi:hypothetical protein